MGFGGRVFKEPPDNLTPVLDTPQAAQAAEYYANLLVKYGPSGLLSYTDDQAMRPQLSVRPNIRTQAIGCMTPLPHHHQRQVQRTIRYHPTPTPPAPPL